MPCSLKDGSCLTDRKATNNEEYGTTLILSVDDEPINHMVIEECISGTGYKVKQMPSGTSALVLKSHHHPITYNVGFINCNKQHIACTICCYLWLKIRTPIYL